MSLAIHVSAGGLPRRGVSSYNLLGRLAVSTETRFTGRGTRVSVKAPHGVSVVDGKKFSIG